MKCSRCQTGMLPGVALPEYETLSRPGPGKAPTNPVLVGCAKCPECGHSEDPSIQEVGDQRWMEIMRGMS